MVTGGKGKKSKKTEGAKGCGVLSCGGQMKEEDSGGRMNGVMGGWHSSPARGKERADLGGGRGGTGARVKTTKKK